MLLKVEVRFVTLEVPEVPGVPGPPEVGHLRGHPSCRLSTVVPEQVQEGGMKLSHR